LAGAGGSARQLTTDPADEVLSDWSPDGKTIAYISTRAYGAGDVWTISTAGGSPKQLTTQGSCFNPIWCGAFIVYSSSSTPDGKSHIWSVPATGGISEQLTLTHQDSGPDCSPDGKSIVYSSDAGEGSNLCVIAVEGGTPRQLTNAPRSDFAAQWSPDGSKVAFVSNRDGNNEIYVIPAMGGSETRLTNTTGDEFAPRWFPDGKSLVYALNEGDSDIHIMKVESVLAKMGKKEIAAN
jgi:Tol biopolymer transport system component